MHSSLLTRITELLVHRTPAIGWLRTYPRAHLPSDLIAGSALETLENMIVELRAAGVTLHFSEVKGPLMDRLQRTSFLRQMGEGKVFLSTQDAVFELVAKLPSWVSFRQECAP